MKIKIKGVFIAAILTAVLGIGGRLLAYSDGDGTAGNPYQIGDVDDLLSLVGTTTDYNKCFILTADVNLDGRVFTTAIIAADTSSADGFQGTPFTGVFDGNGRVIRNMTINDGGVGSDYVGLFGRIQGNTATVKNLRMENTSITVGVGVTASFFGGLCGYNYYGNITDCSVEGSVTTGDNYCTFWGGLCGINQFGVISNCFAAVSLTGGTWIGYVGGLCGRNDSGTIVNSYATGSITAVNYAYDCGGLCGDSKSGSSIINCWATGNVNGGPTSFRMAGLCGSNMGSIANCFSTGRPIGSTRGGLCAQNSGTTYNVSNCFWDTETSMINVSAGGTGKTTALMMQKSTFTGAGWDFTNETFNGTNNYWRMCTDGTDYPLLNWESIDGDFACPDGANIEDLNYYVDHWLVNNCTINNNYCGGADLNYSGVVDLADWAIFSENWLVEI